jgi:hypothetical protein
MIEAGEVILVYVSGTPTFYGRIERIIPAEDEGYMRIDILVLNYPPQSIAWIITPAQLHGEEFLMYDYPHRIFRVKGITFDEELPNEEPKKLGSNVIDITSRIKRSE